MAIDFQPQIHSERTQAPESRRSETQAAESQVAQTVASFSRPAEDRVEISQEARALSSSSQYDFSNESVIPKVNVAKPTDFSEFFSFQAPAPEPHEELAVAARAKGELNGADPLRPGEADNEFDQRVADRMKSRQMDLEADLRGDLNAAGSLGQTISYNYALGPNGQLYANVGKVNFVYGVESNPDDADDKAGKMRSLGSALSEVPSQSAAAGQLARRLQAGAALQGPESLTPPAEQETEGNFQETIPPVNNIQDLFSAGSVSGDETKGRSLNVVV